MRCVFILVGFTIIFLTYTAEGFNEEEKTLSRQAVITDGTNEEVDNDDDDDDDDYYEDYDYPLQDRKGHKIKHKHKLQLLSGGLKSLAVFLALKIKIVLIVIAVIGIIGFTLKVFGALKFAGYWGASDCPPVIHEPAYGLGYSATPPPHEEHVSGEYGSWNGNNNDWSSTGSYARSLVENYIDTDFVSHALRNMDMAELLFATLDMNDDQCRRRLVCEIDAKTRPLPFLSSAMNYFSNGFAKYRTPDKVKFNECAKIYAKCDEDISEENTTSRIKRYVKKNKHRSNTLT